MLGRISNGPHTRFRSWAASRFLFVFLLLFLFITWHFGLTSIRTHVSPAKFPQKKNARLESS
ncbi:hypothetical protein BDA96_04G180700 [Sorghum bicolor]|uniref:Uncharacterized protein n=2 Tax=Sorghum bicolor TaxID=4558 RepID=A0A1Z5RMW0_SORBI|nr:hypothetical protein BDA96_04G180700 [Sorghum bicolor]OQU85084.1 hypothetical protein SORBI_3004G168366 [Sorghum bicolor]